MTTQNEAATGEQPVQVLADERAAFERWAKEYGRIFLDRAEDGGYEFSFTQEAWVGWQARARAALAAAPQPTEAAPQQDPVATLHDDGCFTWKRDEFRLKYDRQRAGWRMEVYAAPQPVSAEVVEAIKQAVREYHLALDKRMHGGVAQGAAMHKIEAALGMSWVQGAALAAAEAAEARK